MPIYQCICPEGLLDQPTREAIAEEITRIHCDATGVPPSFVNVLFTEMTGGTCFVAGRELSQMWSRLTGQAEGELLISLWENPPENVMEAGLIFPALGQEEQWFEENRARLTELGIL